MLIIITVVMMVVIIWAHARKARGTGRAASPLVFPKLWERTKGPLEGDALRWNIVHVFRRDDLIRRNPVLHPSVEG